MKNNYLPDWNIPDFSKLAEIARPFAAIRIMGEAQFVYWDVMDSQLIDDLIESNKYNLCSYSGIYKKLSVSPNPQACWHN